MRSVQMSSFQKEPLRAAIKTSVNFVHNADGTRLKRSFMASSSETAIWIMHWLSYSLWHQLNFVSQNLLNRLRGVVFDCTTTLMRTITCRNSIDDSCVVLLIIHEPRHLSKPLRYMYVEKYKKKGWHDNHRLWNASVTVRFSRGVFNCSQFERPIELAFIDSFHIKTNLRLLFVMINNYTDSFNPQNSRP